MPKRYKQGDPIPLDEIKPGMLVRDTEDRYGYFLALHSDRIEGEDAGTKLFYFSGDWCRKPSSCPDSFKFGATEYEYICDLWYIVAHVTGVPEGALKNLSEL